MELQFEISLEGGGQLVAEPAVGIEPRDLIFVLVGHQFVGVARHRLGQTFQPRRVRGLGLFHLIDQALVAGRVGGVLIGGQFPDPVRDDLVDALWDLPRDHGAFRDLVDGVHIHRGLAAPGEGVLVQRDRDSVHLNRLLDRGGPDRNQPELIGITQHEQVGGDRIAEQPRRQPGRVDEPDLGLARRVHQPVGQLVAREFQIRVAGEMASDLLMRVDDDVGFAVGHDR